MNFPSGRFRRIQDAIFAAAAGAMLLLAHPASAQLEQMGIQNTNNSAALQEQSADAVKSSQNSGGQCTDPDPSNCGAGGSGGGGLGGGNGRSGNDFQFQQPDQKGEFSNERERNDRSDRNQSQFRFRPQPPTEFQRYVGDATGIFLPIFGIDLFQGVPSTFAPLDNVPVTPDYVVGPGDEVLVQAYGQINFDLRLTVDRSGQIEIPKVGTVRVAGLKFSQLQPFLQQEIGRQFRNFTLNVTLGQLRTLQVFVTGQARRPGSFTLSSLSTLVNALFAVGGPSANGSMRNIQLMRGGTVVTTFDVYDLLLRGDKSKDVQLLPGDVIFFPAAGPRVAIFGSLDRPAIYELKGPATLDSLLELSGGLTAVAATQHAELERILHTDGHASLRHLIEIPLDAQGKTATLQDGDVVRILSLVPKSDNAIVLRGNVANPGSYAWHPGMKVRELIPDRDSLLTRDYWRQRARLGLPVLDYTPNALENPTADAQTTYKQKVVSGNDLNAETDERASQAQGFKLEQEQAQQQGRAGLQARGNTVNESTLGASNTLTQQDTIGHATAAGAAPPLAQRFPPKNNVELGVADINWSYAAIERTNPQTLQTEIVSFNLGDLVMNGDESQNVALQAGDVVTIFSQADIRGPRQLQTRLVHIEGEIAHAGVYSVQPGETLRQVVARAGGLTAGAYLYGASFTRESVRQQQQQRLEEYVTTLTQELRHSSEQAAVNGGGGSAGSAEAADASEQRTLAQLRALRASGRVVLSMAPTAHDIGAIPDLPLEDGDHLLIPPLPSSVNVIGSVYNQNSFVFESGRRAGDYLRQAGGADRLGDARHEFIIRADGAVVSRSFSSGKLLASFNSEPIHPGDTLIVPQKLITESALRIFLDYTSVFSSVALAAATISIIK